MHTEKDFDLNICKLSKMEGHADLDIIVRNGKVENVNLRIMENKRFFIEAAEGKPYSNIPQLVSRICGTCSIAHLTGCIEAVEKTLGIMPSRQTILLRKLTMYSLMIRDHALHLYFFAMPDLFGLDSMLDFEGDKKELIHKALHIKEAGNNLSTLVAGRAVHAPFEQIGGFSVMPDKNKVEPMIKELENIREYTMELIDIFYQCDWKLERKTQFVALAPDDYSFLEGEIKTSNGSIIKEENFWNHLQNVVLPYSQASGFNFEGKEYMVGALSRMNLNKDNLHPNTKVSAKKYLDIFPSNNIYRNNLAQAIEILHSVDHSIEILRNNEFSKETPITTQQDSGEGVGVIEAPRGTLYYWMRIDDGKIGYLNLVIPTAQNLINLKEDIKQQTTNLIKASKDKEIIKKEAEKLIRAYDPCMSCASHFLQVNWVDLT